MKKILFIIIAIALFPSCSKEELALPANGNRGDLVRFEKVGSMTTSNILNVNEDEDEDFEEYLKYDIDLYSIVYNSTYKGKLVELSGLVMIPNTSDTLSLVQYHHGTLLPIPTTEGEGSDDAPSLYKGGAPQKMADFYETRLLCAIMTSNGYIVAAPDYAGYNVSSHLDHPYTYHPELAESSVDMLRASEKLINALDLNYTSKVFLTGWSEGGGAALMTHKYLEQKYSGEFNLIASAPLAGPYDYKAFIFDLFNKKDEEWIELSIYSWACYAWNTVAGINRPADQIWTYEVNNPIEALNVPSDKPSEVFKSFFIENINNGDDPELISLLEINSLIEGWAPQAKVFFHSGINDNIVPHYNSVNAYNAFRSQGADVVLYEYPGDHYTPAFKYLLKVIEDFNQL